MTKPEKDLTKAEYLEALRQHGFEPMRHRNYVRLTEYSSVSTNNSPDQSNRGKLAFLIAAKAERNAFLEQCRREVAAARAAKGE